MKQPDPPESRSALPAHIAGIVSEIVRLDVAAQVAYVDQVCGSDRDLRREIERALHSLPEAEFWGSGAPLTMGAARATAETVVEERTRRPLEPGSRLSHYLIEEKIGQGGMGEVFRANDLALGRPVAIKILRDLVDPSLRARLAREAHAGARVDHAAVATFIEFAHADGVDYLAMEFVDGRTLRSRLREGALPLSEALALVRTLLEALVYAHSLGILHRDIKPENIMLLPDGGVKLLDFGIAKDVTLTVPDIDSSATSARTVLETMHGAIVGTPGYMAPEQVHGEDALPASDVFSLGAVLYECVSGRMAFAGESGRALMLSVLSQDPEPLDATAGGAEVQAVVTKALARNSADRYQSAREFLSELRQVEAGESVVHLPKSLALLDFENLREEPEHDWIGSGLAESLAVDLGRVEGLEIIPRPRLKAAKAAMLESSPDLDPAAIGLAVRSRWVLSGTFQRAGESLRMTARLVEVSTARELWSEKLDGALDSVLQMQDELAARVAESLGVIVPAAPAGHASHELDAFQHYQKALNLWGNFERRSVDDMIANLRSAIELEPDYAEALALMASAYAPSRWIQTTDPADLERCIEYATRAIDADPGVASAHVALGYAFWRQGKVRQAIEEEETAVRLDPASFGNYFLGACYCELGKFESALEASQAYHAVASTPFNLHVLGFEHMQLDHRAEARWALREGYRAELRPDAYRWQGSLTSLAEQKRREGDLEAARADIMESLAWIERSDTIFRSPIRIQSLTVLGRICADQGDELAARTAFDQAVAATRATPGGVGIGHFRVQALAGRAAANRDRRDLDEAIELFEQRESMNFGFITLGSDVVTSCDLARSADVLGDQGACREYRERSRALGMPEHLLQ